MDTSSFVPDSHVAQRSRRDKLRIQQSSSSSPHGLDVFTHNLEDLSVHPAAGGLVQARNMRNVNFVYDPSMFPSETMLNFTVSASSNALPSQRDDDDDDVAMVDQEIGMALPQNTDPQQGFGNWRGIGDHSHQSYDWMVANYDGGLLGGGGSNHKTTFFGEVLSSNAARLSSTVSTSSSQFLKPNNINGFGDDQDHVQVQSSFSNSLSTGTSGHDHDHRQKQFREMQLASLPIYHSTTTLHDVAPDSRERVLLPSYVHSTNLQFDNSHQWIGDPNTQGLSLSLSSNPPSKMNVVQFGEGYDYFKEPHQDLKMATSSCYPCPIQKPSIISRSSGKPLNEMVGPSNYAVRNTGPLGPFTGYATILKSSQFLRPAQDLLDEICNSVTCSRLVGTSCEVSKRIRGEAGAACTLANMANATDTDCEMKCSNDPRVPSSTYSSNEGDHEHDRGRDGGSNWSSEYRRPEYQEKKAKLLYLQEEVCRRYKQYHQQMQMVASSFESVTGLSASTPYVSLVLKTVSRNFRCLKHAISDQLKHVTNALGEDSLSPNNIASCSKGDNTNTSTSRLRYTDQGYQKQRFCGASAGFFEPQQHVWRPQRGLPERSVAILRAWLFDHFLHPYPTDTDKHMLAVQTGLSRNQVSNWFINARVRVWKPMVEEIHMLESKGLAETNQSSGKNDGNRAEGTSQATAEQTLNKLGADCTRNKKSEHSGMSSLADGSGEGMDTEQFERSMDDGSLMRFLPYQRNPIDVGGIAAVSLTLGLRHGVENAQQHQQSRDREDQLRRQYGGQMIHEFVG